MASLHPRFGENASRRTDERWMREESTHVQFGLSHVAGREPSSCGENDHENRHEWGEDRHCDHTDPGQRALIDPHVARRYSAGHESVRLA